MRYEGIGYDALTNGQRDLLLQVLDTYVGRLRPGHAQIKSPVIRIGFDHQRGVALDNDEPSRQHIHTVVRTPNGNDYGIDLLRQHRQRFDHTRV